MSQELRAQFEADCFAYYRRLKASGWAHSAEGDQTPESLFWRRETNPEMYGIHQIEAAWQGYQMRAGRELGVPALVVEQEPGYWSRGHFYEGTKPWIDPTKVWGLPVGTKLYVIKT